MRLRLKMERQKTVTEQIEEIKNDICNNYCKWPDVWDEEAEGVRSDRERLLPGLSA